MIPTDPVIAVIGAGSWGTAIAGTLASKGYKTLLWGHRVEQVKQIARDRENKKYLPGFRFPSSLFPVSNLHEAIQEASVICMVVPSHGFRSVFSDVASLISDECHVVSAVKGIENKSLLTMTEVMSEVLSTKSWKNNISLSVLSGPSFAKEVALKMPTAVTLGCSRIEIARELQRIFCTDWFRVYASNDIKGLEISSSLKNIIAIAAGICDGLGFGLNSRAALITRGLVEIKRLGVKMGAAPTTFYGLSGLGDLVLTCTGDLSRNRSVGIQLGQGKRLSAILSEMDMVAEGIKTTQSVYDLSRRYDVEMPILQQVYSILYEGKDCTTAVLDLLTRDLTTEE